MSAASGRLIKSTHLNGDIVTPLRCNDSVPVVVVDHIVVDGEEVRVVVRIEAVTVFTRKGNNN